MKAELLGPHLPMVVEPVELNFLPVGYWDNDNTDEGFLEDEDLPEYGVGINTECVMGTMYMQIRLGEFFFLFVDDWELVVNFLNWLFKKYNQIVISSGMQ